MAKAFASQADLEAKQVTFTQLSPNAYAYTAEGDPNSGVIIGDDSVLIVDTTATPAMAQSDWPNRPITLIVPFAAGGGVDASARMQAIARPHAGSSGSSRQRAARSQAAHESRSCPTCSQMPAARTNP